MRILSVDGGGYLGLATAAFIEGVEDHFDRNLGDCFDLFCGTSTGAIIALGIAAGKSGAELRHLYSELGKHVLVPRFGRRWKLGLRIWRTTKKILSANVIGWKAFGSIRI